LHTLTEPVLKRESRKRKSPRCGQPHKGLFRSDTIIITDNDTLSMAKGDEINLIFTCVFINKNLVNEAKIPSQNRASPRKINR